MSNIQRKVAELYPHPKNQGIYGDEDIQKLAQSIKENGLSEALIITLDSKIISGHRRWKAVKLLGWETVNVIEIEFPNEAEELKALLLKNQVRRITIEQICREGIMWEAILSPKSLQRRRDKNGSQGTTRDKVAALIGLESGSTFYKGKRVVQAIDEAEKNGDIAKATRLREALNKKINSGDELREVLSYIDKADKLGYIDEAEALKKVYEENGIHAAFTSPVLTILKKNIKSGKKQALPTQTNKENSNKINRKRQNSQTRIDNNQKEREDTETEPDVKQSQTQHTVVTESNYIITNSEKLKLLCDRFHLFAEQLKIRHGKDKRHTLEIHDEYDVQDLFHALLTLYFDDIRDEEWTTTYAGRASRTDFLLKQEQTVIEIKKTREKLTNKEVGEQLIIDIARYKSHPDCKNLICFVYDPERRIKNPRGIENDLSKTTDGLGVKVFIRPI